jgi:hypothetical protein
LSARNQGTNLIKGLSIPLGSVEILAGVTEPRVY